MMWWCMFGDDARYTQVYLDQVGHVGLPGLADCGLDVWDDQTHVYIYNCDCVVEPMPAFTEIT